MAVRFDMIGIFTEDLNKMVIFYRDVLGLQIEWDGQGPYAEFKHDGIRFSMYERSQLPGLLGREPSYPDGLNGTFELAIDLPCPDDVDKEYKRIVDSGARPVYPPREEPWGMYSSMIMDPEGNLIEIGSWKKGKP
jgi:lactoylglutathione lyase